MGLNTYPYSPFPASTEQLHKGDNEQIQAEIDQLKSDLTDLSEEVTGDATTYPYADVITIEDAVPSNLAGCVVKIEPVQSGSGDPSPTNIRPIIGHTEVDVQRDGVNIFGGNSTSNPQYVGNYYINGAQYNWSKSANAEYNCFDVEVFPNTQYRMVRETILSTIGQIRFLDINKEFISGVTLNANVNTIRFSTPSGCRYIEFAMGKAAQYGLSINYPSNDENYYSKYLGKTYIIALGDTIYGGTVDFDSGVMTVTHAVVDMGTLTFYKQEDSNYNSFYATVSDKAQNWNYICSQYNAVEKGRGDLNNGEIGTYNTTNARDRVCIRDDSKSDLTGQEFALAMDGVQLCYELATPTTIQLTPQQIQLLKGTNTLTASTGQISVTANGVSGSIGAVQEQVNATDAVLAELAADIAEKLPSAPTTDGAYILTLTVESGTPAYSWESAE